VKWLYGFDYDHAKDDYKVIQYVQYEFNLSDYQYYGDDGNDSYRVSRDDVWEIYSLRSNSWRKLNLKMPYGLAPYVGGVHVYLNGVCRWWTYDDDYDKEAFLVSFDLSKEMFCKTLLPSTLIDNFDSGLRHSRREMRHLTVLNDHIAMITCYNQYATFHISILGELGVKESWTKLFILGPFPSIDHPIGEGKNGDLFFRRDDNVLVWFHLRTQIMEELGIKGKRHCCQVVIYKESHLPFLSKKKKKESHLPIGGING